MGNTHMVVGAVEVNGPVVTQILIQEFEAGHLSEAAFLEKLRANNQAIYDYIKMLGTVLRSTDEIEAWHDIRAKAMEKRKVGEYLVKDKG